MIKNIRIFAPVAERSSLRGSPEVKVPFYCWGVKIRNPQDYGIFILNHHSFIFYCDS